MLASINGTKLFYTTEGSGFPLLVMHGGLGFDHTYFRPWLDGLGDRLQLVYYDHRGNGRSNRTASLEGVNHDTWVDDADALRAHLGHERMVLFGHSYGGFLGLEYALRHGNRLCGLVLCSTAPAWDYGHVIEANARTRGTPKQVDAALNRLARPVTDDASLRDLFGTIFPMYFRNYDPGAGAAIDESTQWSARAYNRGFVECLPTFNVVARLGEITTPTLVVAGRDDWITPVVEGAERIHARLPNSELVVFEDSGHLPFIEERERFLSVVGDWIAGLD